MEFTDEEKSLITQFIYTAIQNNEPQLIIAAFLGILQNDQETINGIKLQLSGFLQLKLNGINESIESIDSRKETELEGLNAQKTLFSNLLGKL